MIDTKEMVRVVAEGIRVLRTRDGVQLTEVQVMERAKNIVMGLLGILPVDPYARTKTEKTTDEVKTAPRARRPTPPEGP